METEYCGKIIRLLIMNHSLDKLTKKADIRTLLKIPLKEIASYILKSQEMARDIGLEIVGVGNAGLETVDTACKYFLRRTEHISHKRVQPVLTKYDRIQYLIFMAILVENNSLTESHVKALGRSTVLDGFSITEFLREQKSKGYLTSKTMDEETVWSLGWRFNVEFDDIIDINNITDIFESVKD